MAQNNKLELTWVGKYDEKPALEPRILIENPEYSYGDGDTGNMLIHGDNLLALKALEQDYAGKVKCIYIDPPYNTGNAFEYYDDGIEHSIWINLMQPRLSILRNLLSEDGTIYIQIDDNEYAYLKVLCDEIFGRNNFVSTICVKMSTVSGVKTSHKDKTIIKEKEMILVYCKNADKFRVNPQYVPLAKVEDEFQYYLEKNNSTNPEDWSVSRLKDVLKEHNISPKNHSVYMEFINTHASNIWRRAFIRNEYKELSQHNPDKIFYIQKNDQEHYYYRGREMYFLSDKFHSCLTEDGYLHTISNLLGDIWLDINTGKLFNEGGVEFRNSKKPEFLVARILEMSSKAGDIVLDSFLGSGTTAAVAHKMGRKYIGIELGDHAYSHAYTRIKNVIDGADNGGMTKAFDWKGGGGFKFYELAPSLLKEDKFGNLVINKEYNADMLAAAMAKQEGFTYSPDADTYWKQGYSSETDFIYTTTQFMTAEGLAAIHETMREDESLLICCTSFQKECRSAFPNITIKKIPQMLLGRCEFGKDDYSLNIIDMPQIEDYDEDFEDEDNVQEEQSDDMTLF